MSSYFKKFPEVLYKFGNNETSTKFQNISVYIDILDQIKEYVSFYQNYQIQNSERPDQVSFKLYGTSDHYWTFWLMNDHLREQHWPIANSQLYRRAQEYYPHLSVRTTGTVSLIQLGEDSEPNKPLSRSASFKVGAYVWFEQDKRAGQIVRIDQDLALLHIDFKGTPFPTITDGVLPGINTGSLVTIDEASANYIIAGNYNFTPTTQYERTTNVQTYRQYDAPHHYEDANGNWVQPSYSEDAPYPFIWSSVDTRKSVSYFERLRETNDELRSIKVIKPDVISQVLTEWNALLTARS
jgi:hypothetical protein